VSIHVNCDYTSRLLQPSHLALLWDDDAVAERAEEGVHADPLGEGGARHEQEDDDSLKPQAKP
jgi:hypothetical protein